MESEMMKNSVKIWSSILVCLCLSYCIGLAIPKGMKRLIFLLPIIFFFMYLPIHISSMFVRGFTSFFIAWLANFKLLLFAFGKGPLSTDPHLTLPRFIALASVPINIQDKTPKTPKSNGKKASLNYAIKAIMTAILMQANYYNHHRIHPNIMRFLNIIQIYFSLELALAAMAGIARVMLGLDMEPQFKRPYLATSLQDFWSRRWNLMVPNILKPTVYEPVRSLTTPVVGRKWAPIPGILVTFSVSALMHELVLYHLGREKPNWALKWFFLIQGFVMAAEVALKKLVAGRWQLPPILTWCLTMVFVFFTGFKLFLPSLHQCKAFETASLEFDAFVNFIHETFYYIHSIQYT